MTKCRAGFATGWNKLSVFIASRKHSAMTNLKMKMAKLEMNIAKLGLNMAKWKIKKNLLIYLNLRKVISINVTVEIIYSNMNDKFSTFSTLFPVGNVTY